jgi:hypothetical protein
MTEEASERGRVGGKARSEALTAERRSEIARAAVQARWAKRNGAEAKQVELQVSPLEEIDRLKALLAEEESKCLRFAGVVWEAWEAIGEVAEREDLAAAIREALQVEPQVSVVAEMTFDGALAFLRERVTGWQGSSRPLQELEKFDVWLHRMLDPAAVISDIDVERSWNAAMAEVRSSRPADPVKAAIDLISAAFDFFPVCKYKGAEREAWVGRMLAVVCLKEDGVVE